MRIVLAAISLVLLVGCNQGAPNSGNGQTKAGLPTPGQRPGEAGPDLASDDNFRRNYRTINIATCVNTTRAQVAQNRSVAPGTDFRPACTCYIDRAMAGRSVRQLMTMRPGPREEAIIQQCVREHGLDDGSGGQ